MLFKKISALIVVVSGLLLLSGCPGGPPPSSVVIGEPAPEFTLLTMEGERVSLSDFRGQVVVLNFWATWCPPCREEKPTMEQLYQQKKNDGLVILAVNVEENPHQVVSQYLLQHSYSFPILLDGIKAEVQGLYGVFRYPESYIIDRDGIVVDHFIGGRDWMNSSTYGKIESLLKN
ncbi:TlpA disulfide reductase family protein [Pelovirga terrestris]|uniref:TlpA family protein disulfide reductase n=1 Tax=Pelovirga terrestris TaxID=2771352 RepID=A0A8J6ULS8_9BACT|nr:TlpA family protein disulfide reductase [Pelovirga terrestris]